MIKTKSLETSIRSPKIYGYTELSPNYKGYIKVGFTTRSVQERMNEHYPTVGPFGKTEYKVLVEESSMREDGTSFNDHDVHRILNEQCYERGEGEWFKVSVQHLKRIIIHLRDNIPLNLDRTESFKLRPEQQEAIMKTANHFKKYKADIERGAQFLWNCKMRFGKTFTAYKLAQEMNWTRVLVITFKPSVVDSWKYDLYNHVDFKDWNFISKDGNKIEDVDNSKPFVCFASFQDFLGKNEVGGIKIKNKWAHNIHWDCIILDEYHFGAWRDTAKELYDAENSKEQKSTLTMDMEFWQKNNVPLTTKCYLYLSGTPFRAISSGEFLEDEIFNWTYIDEQKAKESWIGEENPYQSLPKMSIMTYQLPKSITKITEKGEFDEFDLNVFFSTSGEDEKAEFVYRDQVQKWLKLIQGTELNLFYNNLMIGYRSALLPFSDTNLLSKLSHTFWFLPSVASCYAMRNLLKERQNSFFFDYEVIVCAGNKAGIGAKALKPIRKAMKNPDPLQTKSITLSCGKLTTGVTVKPWSGVFFLRNTNSPETYFQTIFRAQSPWTIQGSNPNKPNEVKILKEKCYVFDFAPNRTLRLISEYCFRLNNNRKHTEQNIKDFIKFLPVLCFDGSSMKNLNPNEVLDYGLAGTSGSQLAKKFESARLVNVDNQTLKRLMQNKKAYDAIMKIEGFRNLNREVKFIINKSEKVKKLKKDNLKPSNKLTEEEKLARKHRKLLQEKLQKFLTRIPIFMYLTDYRERALKDVIQQFEPQLFRKVTGLTLEDFNILVNLELFNSQLLNEAVFSFKRYEDASLKYTGIIKHRNSEIGLYDKTVSSEIL